MTRIKFATIWIVIQCCGFAFWAGFEQARLAPGTGQSILVKTQPVDPRDLLSGQYMRLGYDFNRFPSGKEFSPNDNVWASLSPVTENGRTCYQFTGCSRTKPIAATLRAGDIVIRGRAENRRRASFGVERYFVPEGTETPNMRDVTVRLRIGTDHRARIEEVYVKGIAWP